MTDHFLSRAKAYAALVGGIVAAVLTLLPASGQLHAVLVVVGVIAAGVITYGAPANKPAAGVRRNARGAVDVLMLLAIATLVIALLLFFGIHGHR